ncbi:MAG: ribosome small subunit-dependent GTPase A [Bacteroidetes bacterium]|nr:ribosome small subunit-dependent GTPase A [Bacteroidota bacterium]
MRSTGSRYLVRGEDGALHTCVAKGNLRIKGYTTTNPLAVGDRVEYGPAAEVVGSELVGTITRLHDRRNYIVRRSVNLSHHKHVIAANLDQALMLVTLARPRTSYGFIDRFLVTAEAYDIPALVVFNKVDDYDDEELGLLAEYEDVYRSAGYRTLITSAVKGIGVDAVKAELAGKVTLVAGHSGVGKSTLINAIDPALELATEAISGYSEKGQHTTTYAEMFELHLPAGDAMAPTFIIDTPGVKGFGLVDMEQAEIVDQFPEFFKLRGACRFNDCTHMKEPGCAVIKAVEDGTIAASRYNSYVDMVMGVDEESPYRTD